MNELEQITVELIYSQSLAYIDTNKDIIFEKSINDSSFEVYKMKLEIDVPETTLAPYYLYLMESIARGIGHVINSKALNLLYDNVKSKTSAKFTWLDKNADVIVDIAEALGDISLVNQRTNIYYPAKLFLQVQNNDSFRRNEKDNSNYTTLNCIDFILTTSLNDQHFAIISKNPPAIKIYYDIKYEDNYILFYFKSELLNNEIHLIENIC